jgi:hypothetical protein
MMDREVAVPGPTACRASTSSAARRPPAPRSYAFDVIEHMAKICAICPFLDHEETLAQLLRGPEGGILAPEGASCSTSTLPRMTPIVLETISVAPKTSFQAVDLSIRAIVRFRSGCSRSEARIGTV